MYDKISHDNDFDDIVNASFERVVGAIEGNLSVAKAISDLPGCVFVKNPGGVMVNANEEFCQFFSGGDAVVGRHSSSFLDPSITDISLATDALVMDGVDALHYEHAARGPDGEAFVLHSYKRTLRSLGQRGQATFGYSRPIARITGDRIEGHLALAERFREYRELSEQDKWLCHQIALGASAASIGEELGVARRTVESRKSRVYQKLGVTKAVELARLLVHFQNRGYIDLGL